MAEKAGKGGDEAAAGGSNKKKLMIIVLLAVVLLGGGGAAAWFFLAGGDKEADAGEEAGAESAEAQSTVAAPLLYFRLDEPVTATLPPGLPVHHLRVNFVLTARNQAVLDALRQHTPMIRNDVLEILGSQDYAALNTPEGKEKLRETLHEAITAILVRTGSPTGIEAVLFNEVVMQ